VAPELGRGGKTRVAEASGMSRNTVIKAQGEVEEGMEPLDRFRKPGGGDCPAIDKQPGLLSDLDELAWPETRGHRVSPLRWTLTSTYKLAAQLRVKGYTVSAELVRRLLHQVGYSLQAPRSRSKGPRILIVTASSTISTMWLLGRCRRVNR